MPINAQRLDAARDTLRRGVEQFGDIRRELTILDQGSALTLEESQLRQYFERLGEDDAQIAEQVATSHADCVRRANAAYDAEVQRRQREIARINAEAGSTRLAEVRQQIVAEAVRLPDADRWSGRIDAASELIGKARNNRNLALLGVPASQFTAAVGDVDLALATLNDLQQRLKNALATEDDRRTKAGDGLRDRASNIGKSLTQAADGNHERG
jgi:hypothetical protein